MARTREEPGIMPVFIGGPTECKASVTDFYRRVEIDGVIHYAHNSLSLEQARKEMEL